MLIQFKNLTAFRTLMALAIGAILVVGIVNFSASSTDAGLEDPDRPSTGSDQDQLERDRCIENCG